jgi:hypothetical protein
MGIADNESFKINSEKTSIDNYKLPKIIDVNVSLTFVESKSSTQHGYLYGFDKLPREVRKGKTKDGKETSGIYTTENTSSPAEAASDANNKQSVAQTGAPINTSTPKVDTTSVAANVNNPAQSTSANSNAGMENSAAPKADLPPTYKIEVKDIGDGFSGQVYANGILVEDQKYVSTYANIGDNGTVKGLEGVRASLMWQAKHMGFYKEGKKYAASNNVS